MISFLLKYENIKKPIATIKNLNANAEKGSLLSTIGFVVINAEDHSKININGNDLIIEKKIFTFDTFLSTLSRAFHKHAP